MQKIVTGDTRVGFYVWKSEPSKAALILLRKLRIDIRKNCAPDEVVYDLKVNFTFVLKSVSFPATDHYELVVDCLVLALKDHPLINHWAVCAASRFQPDRQIA